MADAAGFERAPVKAFAGMDRSRLPHLVRTMLLTGPIYDQAVRGIGLKYSNGRRVPKHVGQAALSLRLRVPLCRDHH